MAQNAVLAARVDGLERQAAHSLRISYYRCLGQDGWRYPDGKRCHSHPVRADEIEPLVWAEVRRLLQQPELVRAEIGRRLSTARTEHPATHRRDTIERDLTRASAAVERLIEAYQEQLISLEELRARMPVLRARQNTLQAQLHSLNIELQHRTARRRHLPPARRHPEGFLGRLTDGLDQLGTAGQQRILRLVVREVLIGGPDDTITIRHSKRPDDPLCVGAVSGPPRGHPSARPRRNPV
ncbi:zinc ribbon domain-containing protein [Conexibacter sp. S30A1]|uniref:zinc ribbon domain-containing protein n=1 Tax=Conexibacter sp. S30A1 TaxID=2937800 RepID=UPI00200EAD34|nr:zinc ribbon domain-containing protein [Conexibacter sp. S30A1]